MKKIVALCQSELPTPIMTEATLCDIVSLTQCVKDTMSHNVASILAYSRNLVLRKKYVYHAVFTFYVRLSQSINP